MTREPRPGGVDRLSPVSTPVVAVLGLATVALLATMIGALSLGRPSAGSFGAGLGTGTVAVCGYLPAAKTAIEREQAQLRQEREAFDRFVSEVKTISVQTDTTGGVSPVLVGNATANGSQLRDVRTAYRNTVMEIDHFEREYGEGLCENMQLELSEDVTSAVTDGYQFSQPLKQAVIQQSIRARDRRESVLDLIDTERESLERTEEGLREIDASVDPECTPTPLSFADLFDRHRGCQRSLARYDRLVRDRQRDIHSNERSGLKFEHPCLQRYLYDTLEVDYPVLATLTARSERLHDRRRAIRREITYR